MLDAPTLTSLANDRGQAVDARSSRQPERERLPGPATDSGFRFSALLGLMAAERVGPAAWAGARFDCLLFVK
ncbi:MAG TPA: hypothetical protein VKU02_08180 [Gemmataceae bacterium]|nr:hypothetical protein [Gemmataceae bacterium]